MDSAIGEASSVMGSMMTELIRRSLRGGVLQIGQGLSDYVGERVDATIVEKTPVIENLASEVADRTARSAATEVAKEETEVLARLTRESDQQLAVQIEQTAASAQRSVTEVAGNLTARIGEVEKHATDVTLETARGLATQIEEAEKRACETARGDLDQRLGELKEKSRETVLALRERLRALKAVAADLGKRLTEEQSERKAGESALKQETHQQGVAVRQALDERSKAITLALQEEQAARRAAGEKQAHEFRLALAESTRLLREEITELRSANAALRGRVEELEKPRGLRALLLRLMFWRKSPKRPAESA
jgi:hypothetical protein